MIYIASGWFTPAQEQARQDILIALNTYKYEYFSPREEALAMPDDSSEVLDKIYKGNLEAIKNSSKIIASTIGKDMGTLFECGYAASLNKPIIYYAPGLEGKFNLMLARSAHSVITSYKDLLDAAKHHFPKENYDGIIE